MSSLDPIESAKRAGLRYVSSNETGITRKKLGTKFIYIDESGRRIKKIETLNRIQSLVIPPAWKNVWICPHKNGHLQATGYDDRDRKQYRYHSSYREIRDMNKFGRMHSFADALPKIRRHMQRDLALIGLPKDKVLAAVVNLLDRTGIRVGNDEYAKENDSFGLTTFHDRHVDISGSHLKFHFRGKSGQYHEIDLRDSKLARIVKQCRDIPGYELFQYLNENGEHMRVNSTDVNAYLRKIAGDDFTAKDFRTWHGTGYALEYLTQLGHAQTKTEIKRNLLSAVKATAQFLGNRPATCRKYYIHPAVTAGYTEGTIFSIVESCTHRGIKRYEVAIKLLVQQYSKSHN